MQAHQGAYQVQQQLEDVGAPLVAHAELAAAEHSRECTLDHPPVLPGRLLDSISLQAIRGAMRRARRARRRTG
jgi:hypothetical protein